MIRNIAPHPVGASVLALCLLAAGATVCYSQNISSLGTSNGVEPPAVVSWSVLQDTVLELAVSDLVPEGESGEPVVVAVEVPPSRGSFEKSGSSYRYRPEPHFFGRDALTYSWGQGFGGRQPVEVEILVTPWIVPLVTTATAAGSATIDDIGYYNSHSGTFYLCVELLGGDLRCAAHRYAPFSPGWIPLFGTWRDSQGTIYPDRPALYDPDGRRMLLLDYHQGETCATCQDDVPAHPLDLIEEIPAGAASSVPVVADLDGDGVDSVVFFQLRDRHYPAQGSIYQGIYPSLSDERLWPLAVPQSDGTDALGVYGPDSGWWEILHGHQPQASELWFGEASQAVARFVGAGVRAVEAYDLRTHSLSPTRPDPCTSGGQVVRFPVDPDPPPTDPGGAPTDCP